MTIVPEFTSFNMFHLSVGNYSRRILVGDLIQEVGSVPQTQIKTQERTSPIDQPNK
jgi:hypothetical protein